MKTISEFEKRSELHEYISEKLLKTAIKSIDEKGKSLVDPCEGSLWPGTVVLVIGEIKRLLRDDISNVEGKDLVQIVVNIIKNYEAANEIDTCFTTMGLSAWGTLDASHLIYSQLTEKEQKNIYDILAVKKEFKNNWEAFNSCIEAGNSILKPEKKNTTQVHIQKIIDKYSETGYFDDTDDLGNYNSYGLMSLNYCVKALELLPDSNAYKKDLIEKFRPHCLTYFKLVKEMTFADGTGWIFGRSAGVLGQLQYIIFLEQSLAHGFLDADEAAWARGAIKQITYKMIELFWDEEKQWFCFSDEFHTPYSYRKTYPMHWDLLRYFMQAKEYALIDEKCHEQKEIPLKGEKKCVELITNKEKQTSVFIWSDGKDQFVLPIMGGPNHLTTDCLPKPSCRGIIEGVTENLKPIWVPVIKIKGQSYMPTNYAKATKIMAEDGWDIYEVEFENLYNIEKKGTPSVDLTFKTRYGFRSGQFKREDLITVNAEEVLIENFEMEVLQSAAHPKRTEGYGKVYSIRPAFKSTIKEIKMSDSVSTLNASSYRNYFGLPSDKWVILGKNISLSRGEYSVITEISW